MFLFVLWFLKYVSKLLKAISGLVFCCLNRYVPALSFVCRHKYLSASYSGIWHYSTGRQFLGQITIWATKLGEGKNVYCTIELAHASMAKDCTGGHCAGKHSKKSWTPSVWSDLSLHWEHMLTFRGREQNLFYKSRGKI